MAYEKGSVNEYLEPIVSVEFENGRNVEFMIDTGFNGSLCVPRSLMSDLGLEIVSKEEVFGVGAHQAVLDLSVTEVYWFGESLSVNILINDGDDRLLGSQLLDGKILRINYKNKTLTISN